MYLGNLLIGSIFFSNSIIIKIELIRNQNGFLFVWSMVSKKSPSSGSIAVFLVFLAFVLLFNVSRSTNINIKQAYFLTHRFFYLEE
ncbi:MAG: hypothetical protein CL609_07260 [Anaerolineaceae bacterium]|nr:hypothetical protein [Anaerolineaceae bacterium]